MKLEKIDNGFVAEWWVDTGTPGKVPLKHVRFVATPLDVAELLTDIWPEFEPQEPILGDGFEGQPDATALLPDPTPPEDTHHVPVADHREL